MTPLSVTPVPPPPDVAQPPADAIRSNDPANPHRFIFSKVLTAGTAAAHPAPDDLVTVHYTAWTTDGTTIDDSRSRGTPAHWTLRDVMDGLAWGLQLMVVGEKRRLWIPGAMAHEWATDMLVYDVELLAAAPQPDRPTAGELGTPPADATRTADGIAFKVLRAGHGAEHPRPTSTVTINYVGWTTRGTEIFDDSLARQAPLTVALDTVIPGLSWAIQRMVVGERTRFWIPPPLAYPPPLRAQLLVDVELVDIQKPVSGAPGTVRVQSNSPDVIYHLVLPDGSMRQAAGSQTFERLPPGHYRVTAPRVPLYASGIVAAPADMTLAPGGTLDVTINFVPIVS
jgi:peptidylprolyl isomerase